MSDHWKVLVWMVAGVLVGLVMQWTLPAPAWAGAEFAAHPGGVQVRAVTGGGPAARAGMAVGDVYRAVALGRGGSEEEVVTFASLENAAQTPASVLERSSNGEVIWFLPALVAGESEPEGELRFKGGKALALSMNPDCARATWLALLKMLIVPLVLSSIVAGVAGVGTMKDLKRLGGKTFAYYLATSLLAILVGQFLVNTIRPGDGAALGLSALTEAGMGTDDSFVEVIKRAIPTNIFSALQSNGAMLSIIFFALLLGYFITQTAEPHGSRIRELFESFFEVMMKMAEGVLKLLPYGVFALLVKVTAATGFAPFKALLLYMFTVALALLIHSALTLPMLLKFVGKMHPGLWFKAMSPAIMTAFSTSSSSMTLPVTMRTVEQRGRVSNKVTSFTLPLGATINMDGTALYECIGVIFLSQYYASISEFTLTFGDQAFIVLLALLASVGAAGIPSAGLVMMLTILSALGLPIEGAALLLAVDRPLDMLRTCVNVWSDSCGAAIISRTEGETGPLEPITSG